jgi:hypothetical protein
VFRFDGFSWVQEAKLPPSDNVVHASFGRAVAISGDVALVGASGDDENGPLSGSAYLFRYDGYSWFQEARLLPWDGAAQDYFGRSVAIHGAAAVVGAWGDDDMGAWSGSAYVFRRDGSSWMEAAKLLAADGTAHDWLGWSVGISGNAAVIGADGDDDSGSLSGSAYVFGGCELDDDEGDDEDEGSDEGVKSWHGLRISHRQGRPPRSGP